MTRPTGFILGRFLSPIDQQLCVAILTLKSGNRKTGNMAQVFILRDNVNPVVAIDTGDDYSICGDCPHRKNSYGERSCYVNVARQGPNSVWKAYKNGSYLPAFSNLETLESALKGRSIRWGAYGDPAIIPPHIFLIVNGFAKTHTGYTHQWRESFAGFYKGYFQASCDGLQDYLEASAHGWKTFAVAPVGETLPGKLCPATVDNSQAQCITCRLCDGAKENIYVEAHGTGKNYIKGAN
tara:strand:- start:591 stop:1304 length:714 start_codon:yes stop_codon:yes gene_type:complete